MEAIMVNLRWSLEQRIKELQVVINEMAIGGYKAKCLWLQKTMQVNIDMLDYLDRDE